MQRERGGEVEELTRRRTQMGRALTALVDLPEATTELHPGWWLALSGEPVADLNMALLHVDPRGPLVPSSCILGGV